MLVKNNTTQEQRVLIALKEAGGAWVNGQYFLRDLMLSQYHRALWNLIHKKERYGYAGRIEASDFTDENGFKSYRLVGESVQMELLDLNKTAYRYA